MCGNHICEGREMTTCPMDCAMPIPLAGATVDAGAVGAGGAGGP
jgi:hypothetical protein